jgi:hypothetical protein
MRHLPDAFSVPRYLAIQGGIGILLGLLFALGVWFVDIGNIGTLIARSDHPVVPVIFVLGSVIAVSPLAFATAIGLLHKGEAPGGRHASAQPTGVADATEQLAGTQIR